MENLTGTFYTVNGGEFVQQLQKAVAEFTKRFGRPSVCLVNPNEIPSDLYDGIVIKPADQVMKGHIWLGNEKPVKDKKAR